MPETADKQSVHLENTIDKLENIIDSTEEQAYLGDIPVLGESADSPIQDTPSSKIPVLDRVVNDEELQQPVLAGMEAGKLSRDQLLLLVGKLESKLNGELDMLINVIKGNMKDAIVEEIRSQLDNAPEKTDSREIEEGSEAETPEAMEASPTHYDGYRPYGEG